MTEAVAAEGLATLPAYNPFALIDKALERGVGPEQLGQMMSLAKDWGNMLAEKAYNQAMNECQREMPTVVRSHLNREINKKYHALEDVAFICKPIWTKHGFSLSIATTEGNKPGYYNVFCDCLHVGGFSRKYTLYDVPIDTTGPKGGATKTNIQGMMSSMTYGEKRLICNIFNITVADEDRDGREFISPEQVEKIYHLIRELEGTEHQVDKARFLKVLKAENVEEIASRDYEKAVYLLTMKRITPCNGTTANSTAPNGGPSAAASPPPASSPTSSRQKR